MIFIFPILLGLLFLYFGISDNLNRQIITIGRLSGPLVNPLMGLAPWANEQKITQSHTLVYADLTWREFEPEEGVYEFAAFEKENQLARWRAEGKRVVFRFVTDVPGAESHMDIPDWLFQKIDGDGEFYDNEYGKGFSPDYANPIFLKYHGLAVKALGDRYGGDGFFAFVEMGSLGHWGEWHEYPDLMQLPPENIRNLYVLDYVKAFPNIYLLMRRPFTIARDLNLGLYNDMTGDFNATTGWINWIDRGGDYLPNESNTLVPMPNGWKAAPIGGEQAPTVSDEKMYGSDLTTTLQLLKQSHTTFIGPGGPYDVIPGGPLQGGIDEVLSTIGYRLQIDKVELPVVVRYEKSIQIKIGFLNKGIAPFYYNWEVLLYLFDKNGKLRGTYPLPMNIKEVLPGGIYHVSFDLPVGDLDNGIYTIGVAIIDPLTGKPGVKLANQSDRGDLIQEIGSFEVNWLFDFLENR